MDQVIHYARNPEKTTEASRKKLHEIEGIVDYAADDLKTERCTYVTGINLDSVETAAAEFMEVKQMEGKLGGRVCYHGYQSFREDEVDADTVHKIGVALASELWGDRFQVVVATHCNTNHYHNHFVLNSVSDVDGLKFYNSPADYRRMREVSDRLCKEFGLSVIKHPEGRGKNYGEVVAEREEKPTRRGIIKADLDRAIEASLTEQEFWAMLRQLGYEVKLYGKGGKPLAHPAIKPQGSERYFRLDRLGEGYAKQFYEEAYHFGCEIYGEDNIVSAVMHADEINKAVSEELGKPVYHYHLHIVAIPIVRKEILWSKRCKDEALRGTVKEVINQVSHSKKWKNTVPLLDENGQQLISKYGKPMFRKSYSVLQDKLFEHMTEAGFSGFERGVLGSTAENLSSLDYQIQKDKERLADIQERIEAEQVRYEPAHEVHKTMAEIEGMGQKTFTGKIAVSKDDYQQLTALAKEGITSRSEIHDLKSSVSYYQRQYFNASSAVERLQERYDRLKEKCQPFLQALEHFPKLVEVFVEKVKELFSIKEAQERKEREDRAAARKEQSKHRRGRNDWER